MGGAHSMGKKAIVLNSFDSAGDIRLYIMENLYVLDSNLAHKIQNICGFCYYYCFCYHHSITLLAT